MDENFKRAIELLRAASSLLKDCDSAQYHQIEYDGAVCDGFCLIEDIDNLLSLIPNDEP